MTAVRVIEQASVEQTELGFVVTLDGVRYPKTLPWQVCVFASRTHARRFAGALDAEDMPLCHELIAKHGLFYSYTETDGG